MCTYSEIEKMVLPNGMTAKEVNDAVRREVERIYQESWLQGVSVPFFDEKGNIYLANPDGSEDLVSLNRQTRTYSVVKRTAQPGRGRYAYLEEQLFSELNNGKLHPEHHLTGDGKP